jgi:hypothetical protein
MTLGAHDLTSRARLKLLLRDHTQPRTLSMSAGSRRGGTTGVRTVRARSGSSRLQRSNAGRRRERSRRPTGTPRSRLQGLGGAPCATPALHTALSASTSGVLPGLAPRDEAGRLPSAPTCPAPPATVLSSAKWVSSQGQPCLKGCVGAGSRRKRTSRREAGRRADPAPCPELPPPDTVEPPARRGWRGGRRGPHARSLTRVPRAESLPQTEVGGTTALRTRRPDHDRAMSRTARSRCGVERLTALRDQAERGGSVCSPRCRGARKRGQRKAQAVV